MERLKYYLKIINVNFKLSYLLIGICVVLFIITFLLSILNGSLFSVNLTIDPDILIKFGANYAYLVAIGEYWRLITSVFLHASILHLLFNMYSLFVFGIFVENYFNRTKLFTVFIITGFFASLTSYLLVGSFSVGASGAIFGLLGLLIAQYFKRRKYWSELPIDYRSLALVAILNLIMGFVTPGIDNAAHLGGFIVGILLGLVVEHDHAYESNLRKVTVKIMFGISLLIFAYGVLGFFLNLF